MRTLNNSIYILLLCFALILSCCKSTKDLSQDTTKSLPKSYIGKNDSVNTATINWREYFSDPRLIGLIDTALRNNWDVLTSFRRIEMAQSNVLFSKGLLRPTIHAGVSAGQRKFGLYTMDGAGNITTDIRDGEIVPIHLRDYYPGLQASWEADVWGKLRNHKRAALHRYLASVEGKNFIITSLIAEVAMNYYELIALDNELSILDETIALQENAFELVKVQKEAAVANSLAVKQFEAQLLNSKSLRLEVEQQIIENENEINFLLGQYPQAIQRDSLLFTHKVPSKINTGIPSDLLLHRPDIRQAEFELIASKADVKAARAAFYPILNLTGSLGFQAYKPSLLFMTPESYVYSLFGNLAAPVFNRSTIRSEFKRANAQQLESMYNYQKSIVNGYMEVYNRIIGIQKLEKIYSLKSGEVDALIESIETSTELFRTGRATYVEVILTQQKALQAKLELVDVRKQQFISSVSLYKALGGGWR